MVELPKAYEAKDVEEKWYAFWEKGSFFHANPNSSKPPYCIMIPPPNVTGSLHMGHALVNTLQDVLIRWKRMQGYDALWMPGTDHAGISTQTVVERHLMRTVAKTRKEFDREEFLKHVWTWKEQSQKTILSQLKKLGSSCDWSRLRFTMDEGMNRAVRTMFKKLFTQGLIYRGDYLVNWDPVTQTAIADDEVEYEERTGTLWYFAYPLADTNGTIVIATTRPETMLGDTAVAVSPKDGRYTHLVGRDAIQPLTGRALPIIADDFVVPTFGTGAVKITPAHDHDDYLFGMRHNLEMINIMTDDGKINEHGGAFAGLSMLKAREAVVLAMKEQGRFVKEEPYPLRIGLSYRSKAIIEPHLSKQWFVRMAAFKETLRSIVLDKKTRLFPPHWDNTYFHWIDNLRDWCISRQLWWGHRIPIWHHKTHRDVMICYDDEGVPPEVEQAPDEWIQDEDVLDTWFSSALWPFATLGWPENTAELAKYYPNNTLITGHDILFFWVARMLLMGTYAMGEPPFSEAFLHGLIYGKSYWRDMSGGGIQYVTEEERKQFDMGVALPSDVQSKWEKMSKSKGNIIDPLEIIDEYGADATRMALASSVSSARQIDLERRKFEEYKNFANKVWNGARFVFMNLEGTQEHSALSANEFSQGLDTELLTLEDHWILTKLHHTIEEVNAHLTRYEFEAAAIQSYEFYWDAFCAYYVEIIKPILFGKRGSAALRTNKQKILLIVLLQAIRLMHPMTPFITEELFDLLKKRFGGVTPHALQDSYTKEAVEALLCHACIVAPYPVPLPLFQEGAEEEFSLIADIVYAIRNIRGEMKIPPGTATDVIIVGKENNPQRMLAQREHAMISSLVRITTLSFDTAAPLHSHSSTSTVSSLSIFIPLPEELKTQEKIRLTKEMQRFQGQIEKTETQLSNQQFLEKAPHGLVEKLRLQLTQHKKELEAMENSMKKL